MKNLNCISIMSIAIAVFLISAVQNGRSFLVISSIEKGGEIQNAKRISYRPPGAGNQRIFWPELTTRPWAPPFPSGGQGDSSRGDDIIIIADREYPEMRLKLERLSAHQAMQMKNVLIVKYSAHGVLGADGYAPTALDESGIRAISIDGELEALFDAETRLPIASKYDLTRIILPALWREGIALGGITEHVSVAWSILP